MKRLILRGVCVYLPEEAVLLPQVMDGRRILRLKTSVG